MFRWLVLLMLLYIFLFCSDNSQGQFFKITGGNPVDIQQASYQLSVGKISEESQLFHMCGASIISQTWALSAAHCNFEDDGTYFIRAGSEFIDQGGTVHKIVEVVESPDWNEDTYDSDFTLLKVDPPFEYNNTTQAVELPDADDDGVMVGDMANVTGWGYTNASVEVAAQRLQAAEVPIISQEDCFEYMGNKISPKMICAGYPLGGPDACKGDSGGPLVLQSVQIGVVSWGKGCSEIGRVGVYSRIATTRAWITEVTGI